MRQAAAQRFRRHVDELDLVGAANERIGHGLELADPGDPLDDVVHRFEVLDVDRRDHVDAGIEDRVDVLPPLLVCRTGHVRVRQLVDEHHPRGAGEDRREIHLLERRVTVDERAPGHHFEVADLRRQ